MRLFRTSEWLVALVVCMAIGGTFISGLAAYDAYREMVDETQRVATNLTLTVERDISRDLHLVDTSLQGVITALALPGLNEASIEVRQSALFDAAMNQEEFGPFIVLNKDGFPVNISGRRTLPKANFSDREYFRYHKDLTSLDAFIGPVVIGRLEKEKVITLSRRIPTADGSFAGVVVGTIHLSFFRHAFDRLDLGTKGAITLVQDDGSIILRNPDLPNGYSLSGEAKRTYREAASKSAGFGIAIGPDAVYRFYAYHRADTFPMFVVVGFSVREVLTPLFRKLTIIAALTLLFCTATIYLARALACELKRRHHAEAQLLSFNRELEDRVRSEIAAREEAQGRLIAGQRMEALGQLAGGVAHDFNNVLQAISSANRLQLREASKGSSLERLAGMIGEAADRGASVARRLLVFARQGELHAEPVDLSTLVLGMRDLLTLTLGMAIDVHLKSASDLPNVMVDRAQLETVLVNLATNSRDAMAQSGGLLVIEARRPLPEMKGENAAGRQVPDAVCLIVTDNGCGMASTILGRATEPFFSTKALGKGTGLGLAMAVGFAEQSGGALTITSVVGSGTSVTLWLPGCQSHVSAREIGKVLSTPARRVDIPTRILLVDDDRIVRSLLTEELETLGYEVLEAEAAEPALRMIDATPDILITDLSMPGMDGLALINEVRRRHPEIPAILMTGYSGDVASQVRLGATSGDYVLLHKPLRTSYLVEAIAISLRRRVHPAQQEKRGRDDSRSLLSFPQDQANPASSTSGSDTTGAPVT